ncbi:hypothetical protein [Endozoicomonas acroporae]|uniref:hypothetical protein n=1 Tax=Endozoicomonas acroporae TaxID=1701104 RepID=UPI003D7A83CE
MFFNTNNLPPVPYFTFIGLAPVYINQLNNESHPALYQQFSVASAVPEVQILTNVSKETSFAQSSNLFTHIKKQHHIQPVKQDNWVKL